MGLSLAEALPLLCLQSCSLRTRGRRGSRTPRLGNSPSWLEQRWPVQAVTGSAEQGLWLAASSLLAPPVASSRSRDLHGVSSRLLCENQVK